MKRLISLFLTAPLWGDQPVMKGLLLLGQNSQVQEKGVDEFEGIHVYDVDLPGGEELLVHLLQPLFFNQPLSDATLQRLQRQLILYYRDQGRPIVIVEIPPQDVTNGVVQAVIHEGRVGLVKTEGQRYFSSRLIRKNFHLKEGESIDAFQLQNDLAWFNQSPFHHTDAVYTPGAKEWTTDVELITTDRVPWRFYAGGDNTGITDIGRTRLFAGFDWGNVFGWNHIFTFQGTTSTDRKKFRAVTFEYKAPLPWQHALRLYGGFSKVEPDVPFRLFAKGYSTQVSLRYEFPIKPFYLGYLHGVTLGADYKQTNNTFEFSTGESTVVFGRPLQISQLVAAYTLGWQLGRHNIDFQSWLYWSPGRIFWYQSPGAYTNQRPHAKSKYLYGKIGFSWEMNFWKGCVLSTQVRGQASNRNLVPSEEYGIGGYDTVRGYNERQFNADNAFIGNLELRAPSFSLFQIKDQLTLLAFFDYGIGDSVEHVEDEQNHQYLMGVGPGLRYTIGRYFSARIDWGFKLHQIPGHGHEMIHIGMMLNY